MSNLSTIAQDTSIELAVRAQGLVDSAVESAKQRLAREEGQTAAEYMGILLVIAVIIGVLAQSDIGGTLETAITDRINEIGSGSKGGDS